MPAIKAVMEEQRRVLTEARMRVLRLLGLPGSDSDLVDLLGQVKFGIDSLRSERDAIRMRVEKANALLLSAESQRDNALRALKTCADAAERAQAEANNKIKGLLNVIARLGVELLP